MTQVELLDRCCNKRMFSLPAGWSRVTDGVTRRGDRWWNWGDESFKEVRDSHTFLHAAVTNLQCVIRKSD